MKKLRNLKILLLFCFLAVSTCCSVIAIAPLLLLNPPASSSIIKILNIPLADINLPLPALAFLTTTVLIGFIGGASIGIYYLMKVRIQKEADSYWEGDSDETAD